MQYVIGNWKMHTTVGEAVALAGRIEDGIEDLNKEHPIPTVVICPPFTALSAVKDVVQSRSLQLGAQNVHWADHGAYTGEISAAQLAGLVNYVIVGHSERREAGETDELVARKVHAVAKHGLTPVVCVGEEKPTPKADAETEKQLKAAFTEVDPGKTGTVLVAYEPVWAVGTGEIAEAGHVEDMILHLRKVAEDIGIDVEVLYGGSVNRDNVERFTDIKGLDGLLVGEASLADQNFLGIVDAAARHG